MSLTTARTGLKTELWSLKFLSFHKWYIAAWKISLHIELSLLFWEAVWTHWKIAVREAGGDKLECLKKANQTSLEKAQSKNKCWILYDATPHKRQSPEIFKPQLLNLSQVGRPPRAMIQVKKACFGILYLNQTEFSHVTLRFGFGGWRESMFLI